MHGQSFFWNSSGILLDSFSYHNGRPYKQGKQIRFHSDQSIREIAYYRDNLQDSIYQLWHFNGQLEQQGHWKIGKKEGNWEFWDKNGALLALRTYKNGFRHGVSKKWTSSGKLLKEYNYQNGLKNGTYNLYTPEGKLNEQGSFKEGLYTQKIQWFTFRNKRKKHKLSKKSLEELNSDIRKTQELIHISQQPVQPNINKILKHNISGTITYKEDNTPLAGATIYIEGENITKLTGASADLKGKFSLNSPTGLQTVKVIYLGLQPIEFELEVHGSVQCNISIQLENPPIYSE
ncbi:MAG: hypothetical protein GY810_09985 [Aureispira sp.]|nr:hypothetical protein [Aureispira sp.]